MKEGKNETYIGDCRGFYYKFVFYNLFEWTWRIKKLSDQVEKTAKTYDSQRFIYESFKKTCEGKGFSCFLDWQNYCRNNWKLDYIGFSEAEEFCNDFQLNSKGEVLMYGKWKGPYGEGEVYCIKK